MPSKLYGGSGKESSTKLHTAKHTNRRKLKSPAFESREDALLYVGGYRITCLECGEDYIHLGAHIGQAHRGMGMKEYRKKYNIPHDVALIGVGLLEEFKARAQSSVNTPEGLAAEQTKLDKAMKALCSKNGLPRGVRLLNSGRYQARYVKGKEYYIGTYDTPAEAGEAAEQFRSNFNRRRA